MKSAIDFFDNVTTIEDAKLLFKEKAKLFHPDLGGDAEMFKLLKRQFDNFVNNFANFTFKNDGKEYTSEDISDFKEFLKKVIDLDDVKIEIIGRWVYIYNSFKHKDYLKSIGCWFSSKHKAWIFNGTGKTTKFRTKKSIDMIKKTYGCIEVKKDWVQKEKLLK